PPRDLQLLPNCPDVLRLERRLGTDETASIPRPLGLNEQVRLAHGQPPLRSPPCVSCQSTLLASPQRQKRSFSSARKADIHEHSLAFDSVINSIILELWNLKPLSSPWPLWRNPRASRPSVCWCGMSRVVCQPAR